MIGSVPKLQRMPGDLNRGILSAKQPPNPKRGQKAEILWFDEAHKFDSPVITVPLWKVIIVTIGLCAMSASYAYSVRPVPVAPVKPISAPQALPNLGAIVHQYPDEAVCKAIPVPSHRAAFKKVPQQLAAAVPASALRPWGK